MKKALAALLTLCLVFIVIPTVPNDHHSNQAVSPYAYYEQEYAN